jgi:hypothetical protein
MGRGEQREKPKRSFNLMKDCKGVKENHHWKIFCATNENDFPKMGHNGTHAVSI